MANLHRMTRKKLGEILLQAGVIDELELKTALVEQGRTHQLLGEILVQREFTSEVDIAKTLVTQFSLPYLSAQDIDLPPYAADLLPIDLMRAHLLVPLDRFGTCLTLLVAGLLDAEVLQEIEQHTGCTVQVFVGTASDVRDLIGRIEALAREAPPVRSPVADAAHPPG